MIEAGRTINVMGIPAGSGDARIDGLSALSHQDNIVDGALAQRTEDILPRLRQGDRRGSKYLRYRRPGGPPGCAAGASPGGCAGCPSAMFNACYRHALPRGMNFALGRNKMRPCALAKILSRL